MEYFLRDKTRPEGPYDLMALIRKIRNGTVRESTLLSIGELAPPQPAGNFSELQDFFGEGDTADTIITRHVSERAKPNFFRLLTVNLEFIRNNPGIVIYSGVFVIIWLVLGLAFLMEGHIVRSLVGAFLAYFLFGGTFTVFTVMCGVIQFLGLRWRLS